MIDLHTHTLFSDGALLPFELARRAEAAGYRGIAFTDHMDPSNISTALPALIKAATILNAEMTLDVVAGTELTHIPPSMIGDMVKEARELGAAIVVVHGETLAEPVQEGTNRAAIEAGADILSHPGLISAEDAELAAKNGVALEITTRKGHSITNGHVAKTAKAAGAMMVLNTDTHGPSDMITREYALQTLMGAGLKQEEALEVMGNSQKLIDKALQGGLNR